MVVPSSPEGSAYCLHAVAACDCSAGEWIDAMDAELPPLSNFILPGGGLVGASLHHARAVCRRAERDVVPLVREAECEAAVAVYLNRLSDYLFVAARFAARRIGEEDAVYQKARVRGG